MVSSYDFKNLERDISSLEKDLSKFQYRFNETIKPIINASFNEKKYGSHVIERQIDNMVKDTKNDINKLFSDLINEVRRAINLSEDRIKTKVNEIISYVNELNSTIKTLNHINEAYASENYKTIIAECDNYMSRIKNDRVQAYLKLAKINSYDKYCLECLKSFDSDKYCYFTSYYNDCKKYSASNHISTAREYLFIASCLKIKQYFSELNKDEAYIICNNALECFRNFDLVLKEKYKSMFFQIYKVAVSLFNELAEKAYNSFSYLRVVELLIDSKHYKNTDISINFFKDSSYDEEKMFEYTKNYGFKGNVEDRKAALKGTLNLAKTNKRQSYIEYWIRNYDNNEWSFIDMIIKAQDNRFFANNLISDAIQKNVENIRKKGDLCLNLVKDYYAYLEERSGNIQLDDFTDSAIKLNELVKVLNNNNNCDDEDDIKLREAVSIIDGLNYGMIMKNRKLCNLYIEPKISNLNKVLDDASLRLYGKKCKKNLKRNSRKPAVEMTNTLVKLSTASSQNKNKKVMIITSVAVTIIFLAVIIVIIIFK